jgi:uncharacterized membrane protein
MKKKKNLIILAIGFLIGALGYWLADFTDDRALFKTISTIIGPGTFIGAIISTTYRKNKPILNAMMISWGVLFGMLSRILWEVFQEQKSTDIFPLELLTGFAIVLPVAFLGSFLVKGIYFLGGK